MGEDHLLEPPQLGAGLEAELVHQELAPHAHRLERLRLPPGAVQRHHELPAQALAKGVLGDQALELADQILAGAAGQVRGHALLDRLHAELLEPGDLELGELVEAVVGKSLASPERKRRLQLGRGALVVVLSEGHPRASQKLLEAPRIDRLRIDVQHVAGRPVAQLRSAVAEPLAQARDLLLERLPGLGGRLLAPECLHQLVCGHRLGRAEREHREEPALLRALKPHRVARDLDLEVPQQPDVHVRIHRLRPDQRYRPCRRGLP